MPNRHARQLVRFLACTLLLLPMVASAEEMPEEEQPRKVSPFQLSLLPPVQAVPRDVAVYGARFNILYGIQDIVWGMDFGPYNETRVDFRGLGAGAVNVAHGDTIGAHVALGNSTQGSFIGLQAAWFNQTYGELTGVQAGFASFSGKLTGVQVGVVNVADSVRGVQLGAININRSGTLKFFPIMNFGF